MLVYLSRMSPRSGIIFLMVLLLPAGVGATVTVII